MACEFVLSGIDKIYYRTTPINYFITGDTVLLTGGTFTRMNVADQKSSFSEAYNVDQRGTYYTDSFSLKYSKHRNGEPYSLQSNQMTLLFRDNNNLWYLSGYDELLTVDKLDSELSDRNEISLSLSCDTYQKARLVSIANLTLAE